MFVSSLRACWVAATTVGLLLADAAHGSGAVAAVPRVRGETAARLNAKCESCHAEIAAEWRGSLHRAAYTDPIFQRAYAIEPLPFCRGCHAPEADPNQPPPPKVASLGVGCVTCHVVGDTVVSGARQASRSQAPHTVRFDPGFATSNACAPCHEFEFPDRALRLKPEFMQATLTEHRASDARAIPCADCHMPRVGDRASKGRHRDHRFSVAENPAFIRSSIGVSAARLGPQGIRLTLTPAAAGHAVPTGDLFRRLEVSAELIGVEWAILDRKARYLARHFGETTGRGGVIVRSVTRDDRVGAPGQPRGTIVEFSFASPRAVGIAWRVAYQRVEHPRSEKEDEALLADEITIASGYIPLSKLKP